MLLHFLEVLSTFFMKKEPRFSMTLFSYLNDIGLSAARCL